MKPFLCVFLLALVSGCANHPAPTEQLRLTDQAVSQARAAGASDELAELASAESKRAAALAAAEEGDFKQARMLAEQAELDARLAEAKAVEAKTDAQVADLNRRIERLRNALRSAQ